LEPEYAAARCGRRPGAAGGNYCWLSRDLCRQVGDPQPRL